MKSVVVYCGSSRGKSPVFMQAAEELGRILVERDIRLVYGGGRVGLMGVLADTVMNGGGHVTAVIPTRLNVREIENKNVSDLIVVDTMHERKMIMSSKAEGAIALPGGYGTLEEIAEFLCWIQLHYHTKPCGFLNIAGHFDKLLEYFDRSNADGFIHEDHRAIPIDDSDPQRLLDRMAAWQPQHRDIVDYKLV